MKPIEWTPAIIDRWRTDRGEFRYTVVGHGEPPEDMLRYDDVRITARRDVHVPGARPHMPRVTIAVRGNGCTPALWYSFGWTVQDPVREYRS